MKLQPISGTMPGEMNQRSLLEAGGDWGGSLDTGEAFSQGIFPPTIEASTTTKKETA
jgi:hypothetical protein